MAVLLVYAAKAVNVDQEDRLRRRTGDGSREELGYAGRAELRGGDTFVVETPGGGGYGVEK